MDVTLQSRTEQLANEMADQARTIEDLNKLMRGMMKSALERMLNTEMDVHLGRKILAPLEAERGVLTESPGAELQDLAGGRCEASVKPSQRAIQENRACRCGRLDHCHAS